MVATAARVRPGVAATAADVEVFTVLSTLRALARRIQALQTEPHAHSPLIRHPPDDVSTAHEAACAMPGTNDYGDAKVERSGLRSGLAELLPNE